MSDEAMCFAGCEPWCGGPRANVPAGASPIGYRDEQVFCSHPCIREGRPLHPVHVLPSSGIDPHERMPVNTVAEDAKESDGK